MTDPTEINTVAEITEDPPGGSPAKMATAQKRLLTNSSSKLTKVELGNILRKESAWQCLSEETRRHLYSLLPVPAGGEEDYPNVDVHPLKTDYKKYIEEELRIWQEDLGDGKESKKWREEAMKAGSDRLQGKWDEWNAKERESTWGKQE